MNGKAVNFLSIYNLHLTAKHRGTLKFFLELVFWSNFLVPKKQSDLKMIFVVKRWST